MKYSPTRLLAAAVVLALVATGTAACAHRPQTIAIIVETWDTHYNPTIKPVAIVATGLNKFGNPGTWTDPDTGEEKPYPLELSVETPWTHALTVLPGETTAMDLSATVYGRPGEYVTCAVYVDGEHVGDSAEARIPPYENIPIENQANMSGTATARCLYTLNVPG